MECQRLNSECHRVSEVRFGGMAPVSDAPQSHRISGDSGAGRIGVPSTGLSLSRLLASRADLRFTRQDHDNRWCWQKPDESEFNDQAELREYSLTEGVFCPNNGVHCTDSSTSIEKGCALPDIFCDPDVRDSLRINESPLPRRLQPLTYDNTSLRTRLQFLQILSLTFARFGFPSTVV